MNSITRKALVSLGELHTAGVVLRNRGEGRKFKQADRPEWRKEYDEWKAKVVTVLVKLDPAKAQRIQTLNRIPDAPRFLRARWFVGKAHQKDLQTFERRLEILEQIMYKEL
jgi:uncharacterized coiled-coil DUF342 family protein